VTKEKGEGLSMLPVQHGRVTIRFTRPIVPAWLVAGAGIAVTGSLLYAIVWTLFAAFGER